ncbi:MAG: hypothetical protein AAF830_12890 [Pseudomonadota bacterium]
MASTHATSIDSESVFVRILRIVAAVGGGYLLTVAGTAAIGAGLAWAAVPTGEAAAIASLSAVPIYLGVIIASFAVPKPVMLAASLVVISALLGLAAPLIAELA